MKKEASLTEAVLTEGIPALLAGSIGMRMAYFRGDKFKKYWKKDPGRASLGLLKLGLLNAAGIFLSPPAWLAGVIIGGTHRAIRDFNKK